MPGPRICSIDGCEQPHQAKGYCQRHYLHLWRYGSPVADKNATKGSAEQFLKETAFNFSEDCCLLWPYSRSLAGYGIVETFGGKRIRTHAHRLACEFRHGPAPFKKAHAAHNCGNPSCCNPLHLRWATVSENMLDKVKHGTTDRGERHWNVKLTCDEVREIRRLLGKMSQEKIGQRFNVSRGAIDKISRRESWSWLD